MKIIHCADLHIDSKMETLTSEKSKIRREEVLASFERLADFASKLGVVAVIIAGDMFDTSRVTLKTRSRILAAINKYPEVDFLYLSGNHDDDNFVTDIDVLPNNLKVFTDEWTYYNYGDVVISGLTLNSVNVATAYDRLALNPEKLNIVTLHGQIADYMGEDKAEKISLPKLKNKNIDYLALGHIHEYGSGKLDARGVYAYSGCLEGRGFDETGDKGFVLLNIENSRVDSQFVKFATRNLYTYEFNVEGKATWAGARNQILDDVCKKFNQNSLIKIVLKGSHNTDFDIDKDGLTLRLNELFFFAKVYDKTELSVELSDYELDKSVRGEFVRTVLESNLSSQEKSKIIMCGLNALKGEDV